MNQIKLNNEVQKGTKMCRATEIFQGMCFSSLLSSRANLLLIEGFELATKDLYKEGLSINTGCNLYVESWVGWHWAEYLDNKVAEFVVGEICKLRNVASTDCVVCKHEASPIQKPSQDWFTSPLLFLLSHSIISTLKTICWFSFPMWADLVVSSVRLTNIRLVAKVGEISSNQERYYVKMFVS
jgi:hypothetical protein